jgi:coenzyme PQQ precursor peptide PqqA
LGAFSASSAILIQRRRTMAWKTPRIVEIAIGMEINSYACADLVL